MRLKREYGNIFVVAARFLWRRLFTVGSKRPRLQPAAPQTQACADMTNFIHYWTAFMTTGLDRAYEHLYIVNSKQ